MSTPPSSPDIQPAQVSTPRLQHIILLIASTLCIIAALTLTIQKDRNVFIGSIEIIYQCPFYFMTGWDCPSCGLTRSMISATHLNLIESVQYHPAGWVMLLLILAQIPYRIIMLFRPHLHKNPHLKRLHRLAYLLITVFIAAGIARYFYL